MGDGRTVSGRVRDFFDGQTRFDRAGSPRRGVLSVSMGSLRRNLRPHRRLTQIADFVPDFVGLA